MVKRNMPIIDISANDLCKQFRELFYILQLVLVKTTREFTSPFQSLQWLRNSLTDTFAVVLMSATLSNVNSLSYSK